MRIRLVIGSKSLAVAQLGPDFMILEEPASVPPTEAELVVWVDGSEKRRAIFIPDGIQVSVSRTRFVRA